MSANTILGTSSKTNAIVNAYIFNVATSQLYQEERFDQWELQQKTSAFQKRKSESLKSNCKRAMPKEKESSAIPKCKSRPYSNLISILRWLGLTDRGPFGTLS